MAKSNLPTSIMSGAAMPAHLQMGTSTGNENVTADDIQIPRIKLLQKMSPEVDEGSSKYMEDVKAGQLLNSVTGEASQEMLVLNMFFEAGYTCFKDRDLGGGLFGTFDTEQAARDALTAEGLNVADYDISLTHTHTLLLIDPETHKIDMPAVMDMQSTKLRVSRAWNSDIKLRCNGTAPRFGAVYKLFGKIQTNSKGQSWHNLDFEFAGWASEDLCKEAQENYDGMKATKAAA